jgi:hypothetical protein
VGEQEVSRETRLGQKTGTLEWRSNGVMRTKLLFQPVQQFKQFNPSLHNNESGLNRFEPFEQFERLEPLSVFPYSNTPFRAG